MRTALRGLASFAVVALLPPASASRAAPDAPRELAVSRYLDRSFGASTARLAVSVLGLGRVVNSPPAIVCSNLGSASFMRGRSIELRAVPAAGARFAGWSGGCRGAKTCRAELDRACSVRARFRR